MKHFLLAFNNRKLVRIQLTKSKKLRLKTLNDPRVKNLTIPKQGLIKKPSWLKTTKNFLKNTGR